MATTKRSKITITIGKDKTKPKKKTIKVTIPARVSKPPSEFCKISVFLHGEKKIGKTSLLGREPGAFFLEFDPEQPLCAVVNSALWVVGLGTESHTNRSREKLSVRS